MWVTAFAVMGVGKVGVAPRRGVRRDRGTTDSCQPNTDPKPARINLQFRQGGLPILMALAVAAAAYK